MSASRALRWTAAELDALVEAVTFRLAGETDELSAAEVRALERAREKLFRLREVGR